MRTLITTAGFIAQHARHSDSERVLLLAFRLRDLAQIAWKHGRLDAQRIERTTTAIFAASGSVLLRDADCMIHDDESEWYAIALYARGRSGRAATPVDARNILTRIHLALEHETRLAIDNGWTTCDQVKSAECFEALLQDALQKGARERERYAFFSLIGHELRTPLTSIRGYLETVLEDDLDAVTQRRFVEIAYRETQRMNRLVDNLFDISLLDLRGEPSGADQCSLLAALEAAQVATAAVCARQRVRITVQLDNDVLVSIREDALTQILINLLDNAAKHGKFGGRIALTVEQHDASSVCIDIADDGPGIPAAQREQLFELGERGRTTAPGSGLGLGLVRLFIERAGGEINISDSPFGGVTFRVMLPKSA